MAGRVKQIITSDAETGEIISDVTSYGCPNGKGFVLMYTEQVTKLITECQSAATLKVFMLIAMGQHYDERGYITTKKAVQEKLGITKPTCLEAFKWLKEHDVISEYRIDGHTEFMINPIYVTIGRDRKKRLTEWNRRLGKGLDTKIVNLKSKVTKKKSVGRSIDG